MRVVEEEEKWWIPSPPPLGGGGCVLSVKDGAYPFTPCRWGFYFLVDTRLPWGLLKKKSLDSSPRLDKYSLGRHVHEDEKRKER